MGMDFLSALNISGSGLTAQKMRMDVIAQNIANANVTRTQNGTPYRRKMVVLNSIESRGSFRDTLNKAMGQRTGVGGVQVKMVLCQMLGLNPVRLKK